MTLAPNRVENTTTSSTSPEKPIALRGRSIRANILLIIGTFLGLVLLSSAFLSWLNYRGYQESQYIEDICLPTAQNLQSLNKNIEEYAFKKLIFMQDEDRRLYTEAQRLLKDKIQPEIVELEQHYQALRNGGLRTRLGEIIRNSQVFLQSIAATEKVYERVLTLSKDSIRRQEKNRLLEKFRITNDMQKQKLLPVIAQAEKDVRDEVRGYVRQNRDSLYLGIFTFVFNIVLYVGLGMGFYWWVYFSLSQSVEHITRHIKRVKSGNYRHTPYPYRDEFAPIAHSLNEMSGTITNAIAFAKSIGEGNLQAQLALQDEHDTLGNTLIQMRDRLREASAEDERRAWLSQGLTKFADLFRQLQNQPFEEASNRVLAELIEYTHANQGGLFLARESDDTLTYLDMVAGYAYHRQKYLQKRLKVHPEYAESLLGQVYLEQEKIYMTQLPQNYLRITSGLGEANPQNLLIIPLKYNNQVEGVLELAAFHKFDKFEIELIERTGENLASSIAAWRVNERTRTLLHNLQEQTEQMRAQEEEMRQNLEELASTQEQMALKQNQLEQLKADLEHQVQKRTSEIQETLERANLLVQASSDGLWDAEPDEAGRITLGSKVNWSDNFLKMLGYSRGEFGQNFQFWQTIIHPQYIEQSNKEFIAFLRNSNSHDALTSEYPVRFKSGEYRWVRASTRVLRDTEGKSLRVAGYINDITQERELAQALTQLQETQQAMERKQAELEKSNQKLSSNEAVLRKSIERSRDIEQQLKQRTEELSQQAALLAQVYHNVPGVIFEYEYRLDTHEARFVSLSPFTQQLFGISPEVMQGYNSEQLIKMVHPDYRKSYFETQAKAMQTYTEFLWEGQMQHQSNQAWVWVRVQSTPIFKDESCIKFVGLFMDINELKSQAQSITDTTQQLSESAALLQNIYRFVPSMIFQFEFKYATQQVRFASVSNYVQTLFGYTPEEYQELNLQTLNECIYTEDRKGFFDAYYQSIQHKQGFSWEGRIVHRDGSIRWVRLQTAVDHRNTTDKLTSICVFVDLTEIKTKEIETQQRQQQIDALNQQLQANENILRKSLGRYQDTENLLKTKMQEWQSLSDLMPKALITYDSHDQIQYANLAMKTLLGTHNLSRTTITKFLLNNPVQIPLQQTTKIHWKTGKETKEIEMIRLEIRTDTTTMYALIAI